MKAKPPKIVIGTPKQLLSVVRDHEYLFSNIRRVVLDEVDKLIPQIPLGLRRLIKKREKNPKPLTLLLAVLQGISKVGIGSHFHSTGGHVVQYRLSPRKVHCKIQSPRNFLITFV